MRKKILKSTFIIAVFKVISAVLSIATLSEIARNYSGEDLAIFVVVKSFIELSAVVSAAGMPTALLRILPSSDTARKQQYSMYRKISFLAFFVSIGLALVLSLVFTYLKFVKITSGITILCLLVLSVVSKNQIALLLSYLRSGQSVYRYGLYFILPSALFYLLLLAKLGDYNPTFGVPYLLFLFSLSSVGLLTLLTALIGNRNLQILGFPVTRRDFLIVALPMMLASVFSSVMSQSSVFILNRFSTVNDVGMYGVALQLSTSLGFVLNSLNTAVSPLLSKYSTREINVLFFVTRFSTSVVLILVSPVVVLLMVWGEQIINLLYGGDYVGAYQVLIILLIGQLVNVSTGPTGVFLNMTGNERKQTFIMFIASVIVVISGFLLIPNYGSLGAAIVGALGVSLWNLMSVFKIRALYGQWSCFPYVLSLKSIKSSKIDD